MIRANHVSRRGFILQLNNQALRCNYGDHLKEQLCDRLVAGTNNLTLERKLLEKDLTFAEARKICEQHDDRMRATSSEAVTLFQRPNRPPIVKCTPKLQEDPSGKTKRINPYCSMSNVHTCLQRLIVKCSNKTGGMNVQPVILEVDDEPIFLKRRVIPYGQREGVLQALEKTERDGVITRVTSSTWTAPIVIVIKSDSKTPRIRGDYRFTLNLRLRKCAATTMKMGDFMKALHGNTCLSKIDLADAYLHIPLASSCRQFTAINTLWGLHQYNFLPFGLQTSSEIFQIVVDEVICGLNGVLVYQDDIIVFGTTKAEHEDRLLKILERLAQKNVSIRAFKCMFSLPELECLGLTVNAKGYRPDPSSFRSLTELESPRDQNQVRYIMAYLQYYSRFVPNFATKPQLPFVAQSTTEWKWTAEWEQILLEIIQIIADRPVLASFSPTKHPTLITDASDVGTVTVPGMDGRPLVCISRLLNTVGRGYSQTQKEALAAYWAVQRLHKYLFGLRFTTVTDHQALQ
ncbi:unnamed protein product [Echinostoma caproni]|uniref:Reverse transcriptase domain-containing protein n=1 Tax=Echinostoma caproni TaxID=27848 RepID=A0A183AGZ3_9TREM|nr:unnamed protein product [Echinostoma caproni]